MSTARRGTGTLVFAVASVLSILPAAAQLAPREVLLGVSRVGRAEPVAVTPDQAYAMAGELLRGGDSVAGQRALERLVAEYPDSDAAQRARRDLAFIYAGSIAKPQPATDQISYLGAGASPPPAPQVGGGWRTSVRPAAGPERSPQEALRSTAGDLVFFSEGDAELGARARKALAGQAVWLSEHPELPVTIEGHADETGAPEELRALSAARAQAVRARLIAEGIAAERITIVARGDAKPIVTCDDRSCAPQNRRVVTVVGPAATRAAARATP